MGICQLIADWQDGQQIKANREILDGHKLKGYARAFLSGVPEGILLGYASVGLELMALGIYATITSKKK